MTIHFSLSRSIAGWPWRSTGIALLGVIWGCYGGETVDEAPADEPTGAPAADAAPAAAVINMTDSLTFSPRTVEITVGQTVEWVTVGMMPHTVTDKPGSAGNPANEGLPDGAEPFDSGLVEAGQKFRHTFTTPGEYTYLCLLHEAGQMVGKVVVR